MTSALRFEIGLLPEQVAREFLDLFLLPLLLLLLLLFSSLHLFLLLLPLLFPCFPQPCLKHPIVLLRSRPFPAPTATPPKTGTSVSVATSDFTQPGAIPCQHDGRRNFFLSVSILPKPGQSRLPVVAAIVATGLTAWRRGNHRLPIAVAIAGVANCPTAGWYLFSTCVPSRSPIFVTSRGERRGSLSGV